MTVVRDQTGAGLGDAFDVTSTAITRVGGRLQVDQVAGAAAVDQWNTLGLTAYAVSMEFELSALPPSEQKLMEPFTSANLRSLGVAIHQSGDVRLRDAANVDRGLAGVTLVPGTQYRVEVKTDGSTSASVDVYTRYGTVSLGSVSYTGAAGTFAPMDKFRWGAIVSTVTMPRYYVDRLRVNNTNTYLGPSVTNAAPTATATASPTTVASGGTFQLIGTGSDSDGTISSYAWDDITTTVNPVPGTGANRTVTAPTTTTTTQRVYRLTVTDNVGNTGTAQVTVTITGSGGGSTLVRQQTGGGVGDPFDTTSTAITRVSGRLQVDQVAGASAFDSWTGLGLTTYAWAIEFELSALPSAEFKLVEPFTAANARTAGFGITASGDVRLRDAANVDRGLAGVTLVPGTRYRAEMRSDGSTTAAARVSLASSSTPLGTTVTYTGAAGTFNPLDKFRWGNTGTTPTVPRFYVDYLAVGSANTFIGARGGATGRMVRNASGAWVAKQPRVYRRPGGTWA